MKRCILFFAFIFSINSYSQDIQLRWNKDLGIAKELSKAENKIILAYFTKDDCKLCQQFYADVFKSERFKTISDNFIFLMIDGSNQDIKSTDMNVIKQRRLIIHYNNSASFPALAALDKNGEIIGELMTSTNKENIDSYIDFLNSLIQ